MRDEYIEKLSDMLIVERKETHSEYQSSHTLTKERVLERQSEDKFNKGTLHTLYTKSLNTKALTHTHSIQNFKA